MSAAVEASERAPQTSGVRDLTRISLHRSVFLFAAGAIIGLIMAGFSLFTARGTSTLVVPPEDVALVNQQPISRSDYYLQLKTIYNTDAAHATPAQREKILNGMIREELFVQRGKELDVASFDSDVRSAMVNAVEQGIASDVIASRPSDEKLTAYFMAHQDLYSSEGTMTVRDLVFPPQAIASVEDQLRAGRSIDTVVAANHGKDSGRIQGEEFYFAAKIHLGDAAFSVARALAPGQWSGPMPAPDGTHILYMIHKTPPVPRTFAEARSKVLNDYQSAAIARLQTDDETFFRKRANVLVASDMR